jgi:hypothetical protein
MLVISSTYQDNAKALIKLTLLVARLTATKVKVLSICAEASSWLLASGSYWLYYPQLVACLRLGEGVKLPFPLLEHKEDLTCLPWLEPPQLR